MMRRRALRAEIACALRIPERTAENLLANSRILAHDLPSTLRALREVASPQAMAERRERAVLDREVTFSPARDGMAWLSAYLPGADVLAAYNRLTGIAREIRRTPAEERTLTQLRADVFRDLLLDGEPALEGHHGIRPKVFVTVPVLTLLGHGLLDGTADGTAEPGFLDGYGPIDAGTARELAAHAPSFIRLLTHPETSAVLSVGRNNYRVPQVFKNWLQIRDGTCRFPGCSRHASHCDFDHTEDWAFGGQTRHDNLAHLCPSHHRLKHNSAWQVSHADSHDGDIEWVPPSGRRYTTEPETRMLAQLLTRVSTSGVRLSGVWLGGVRLSAVG